MDMFFTIIILISFFAVIYYGIRRIIVKKSNPNIYSKTKKRSRFAIAVLIISIIGVDITSPSTESDKSKIESKKATESSKKKAQSVSESKKATESSKKKAQSVSESKKATESSKKKARSVSESKKATKTKKSNNYDNLISFESALNTAIWKSKGSLKDIKYNSNEDGDQLVGITYVVENSIQYAPTGDIQKLADSTFENTKILLDHHNMTMPLITIQTENGTTISTTNGDRTSMILNN